MKQQLKILVLTMAVAAAVTGCATAVRERVVVQEQPQKVVIRQIPAPLQETVTLQPGPGFTWIQGHWAWRNDGWQWQSGHWHQGPARSMPTVLVEDITVAPGNAHFWIPGHWHWHGNDWEWSRGHWAN